jgi:uncharacterized protein YjbJ (UPF0337 family)
MLCEPILGGVDKAVKSPMFDSISNVTNDVRLRSEMQELCLTGWRWQFRCNNQRRKTMNEDIFKGKWEQVKGSVQKQWGKLTDDDLDQIDGDRKKLAGRIREIYGIEDEAAEKQVKQWEKDNEHLSRKSQAA